MPTSIDFTTGGGSLASRAYAFMKRARPSLRAAMMLNPLRRSSSQSEARCLRAITLSRFSATDFKAGAWTPVYVNVLAATDVVPAPGTLTVETPDSDETLTTYAGTRPLPPLTPGTQHRALLLHEARQPGKRHRGDAQARRPADHRQQEDLRRPQPRRCAVPDSG